MVNETETNCFSVYVHEFVSVVTITLIPRVISLMYLSGDYLLFIYPVTDNCR